MTTRQVRFRWLLFLALAVWVGATPRLPALDPEDFRHPRFANVTITSGVAYTTAIDFHTQQPKTLRLDVYQPTGDTTTDRPVLLLIHGGGFQTGQGSRTQSYIVSLANAFAKRGYVAISIDYRTRSSTDLHNFGKLPAELDAVSDAMDALDWVRATGDSYGYRADLVFVAGGSAGGHTATNLLYLQDPADVTDVVALGNLWGTPPEDLQLYDIAGGETPTIIIHGTADTTVPFYLSQDLHNSLVNAGVDAELIPIQGAGHDPTQYLQSLIIPSLANFFVNEFASH